MISRRIFIEAAASFGVLWAKVVQSMESPASPVALPVPAPAPDQDLLWGQDFLWGTYGKDGKQGLRMVTFGNCCNDHLTSILMIDAIPTDYTRAICGIIKYRSRHGGDPPETHGHSEIVTTIEFDRLAHERYTKITGREYAV